MLFGMSLINSFTRIQENWKFVIICVQNQWGVVHPWHGTVANLWGRHKDFEKSYLLNGLSNIVKFFTVWFLNIFCIKWIHIFFWVQCSFKRVLKWQCWVISLVTSFDKVYFHFLDNFFHSLFCYSIRMNALPKYGVHCTHINYVITFCM